MFGFNQIIKGVSRGFRFHLPLCLSAPFTRPAPFQKRPEWRDPRQVWCDPRGRRVNMTCSVFCAGSLCKALLTVPNVPKPQLSFVGLINLVTEMQFILLRSPTPKLAFIGIQPKLLVWFTKGIHYLAINRKVHLTVTIWSRGPTSNTWSGWEKHQGQITRKDAADI